MKGFKNYPGQATDPVAQHQNNYGSNESQSMLDNVLGRVLTTGQCSLIQLSQTLYFFAGYFERLGPG